MISCYEKVKFNGLLIQGKVHDAVTYLETFEEKETYVKKYHEIFGGRKFIDKTNDLLINSIIDAYANYYIDYFWEEKTEIDARIYLQVKLMEILNLSAVIDFSKCEDLIAELVEQQGYCFLGGMTGMLYGPYIWKSSERVIYAVETPYGIQEVAINMMDGFISRSWLDFISLGHIGTGGWASNNGELFCVRSAYKNKLDTLSFKISYLKHEAQHIYDYKFSVDLNSIDLEYRAKLTELIYYPNLKLLHSFMKQASKSDENNIHSYAAYLIVSNLSREIFNEEYVDSWSRWRGKGKIVRQDAYKLLEEHTKIITNKSKILI